jgi:hypothetical protein
MVAFPPELIQDVRDVHVGMISQFLVAAAVALRLNS